jgi:ribosome-associated protein
MKKETFKLRGDEIELQQLLKAVGCAQTGGSIKVLIQSGEVKVDGLVETRRSKKIRNGQVVVYGEWEITVA